MNELKPSECIACKPWGFSDASDKARKTHCSVCAGTGLVYAIPDTHRVVSVETLQRLLQETLYYASKKELQAIIDNKGAK
jgi:hypothetical protein